MLRLPGSQQHVQHRMSHQVACVNTVFYSLNSPECAVLYLPTRLKTSFQLFITNDCFVVFPQALYKGATRVILATENDYCKLCDASFSSLAVAQAHYQGKNHAKKLRLAEAQQNSSNM